MSKTNFILKKLVKHNVYKYGTIPFTDNGEDKYITNVRMKNGELTFDMTNNRDLAQEMDWTLSKQILLTDKEHDIKVIKVNKIYEEIEEEDK